MSDWTPMIESFMQTFVLLIEECKVSLFRKDLLYEVEKGEAGHTNAVFEHVDAQSLVEIKLFIDGLQKRHRVSVVVPDEEVAQRRHAVIAPRLSTAKPWAKIEALTERVKKSWVRAREDLF